MSNYESLSILLLEMVLKCEESNFESDAFRYKEGYAGYLQTEVIHEVLTFYRQKHNPGNVGLILNSLERR